MAYEGTREVWIVGAARTPVGKHGGALSTVRPDDLAALVLANLMESTGIPPTEVEDVYMGCGNQAGEDNRNIARMSSLLAGFPDTVAGATVNRLCGSGLEAVTAAARGIMLGEADVYVGGGGRVHEPGSLGHAQARVCFPEGPHHPAGHYFGLALR